MREKLIELLGEVRLHGIRVPERPIEETMRLVYEQVADALLADGWIRPPCKVEDTVYRIDSGNYYSHWKPFVQELTVTEISWKFDGIRYKFSSIGKTVFLTRGDAEEALKEGR